jgi:uncharacterized damage-inducible protein DinB
VSKRKVLLEALASMPKDLVFMLRRMEDSAVHQRPSSDQWAIADVLTHLATIETLYLQRLQRIVDEERPYLPYLHPETQPQPSQKPLADLLATFNNGRSETLTYLQALKAGAWQRPAIHETMGETKLRFMVQALVAHDTEHLNQIVEIQQQARKMDL